MKSNMRLLAAILATAFAPLAFSQSTGEVPPPAANHGQTHVATKIASSFTTLAGSPENALALANALRNGTEVTLTTTVPPPEGSTEPPTTTTTSFTPPTGKMGWGNVKHSLALAQDALARAGVANPTAEQLKTALMGGDIVVTNADGTTATTTMRGILVMRSEGMGWGNIAKAGGTKLGHVNGKVKGNTAPAPTTAAGDPATATASGKSKGITTAAGTAAGQGQGKVKVSGIVSGDGAVAGQGPKGHAYGRGITTAAGGGSTNVAAHGGGKPSGAGVVTAGGNNAGGNGNGKGNGKGGGKPGG